MIRRLASPLIGLLWAAHALAAPIGQLGVSPGFKPGFQFLNGACTNLLQSPSDFTQSVWTKSGATVTANAATAPDGSQAQKIAVTSNSFGVYQQVNKSFTQGQLFTLSVWLKADAAQSIDIGFNGVTNNANNATMTVSVTTSWQLFSYPFAVKGSDSGLYISPATASFGGDRPGATVYAWKAQFC